MKTIIPKRIEGRGWDGLPFISKTMYEETYFLSNVQETYEEWLARVTEAYANDEAHAARMQTYIYNYWFHPSTPPSSNAGTDRGLPISCFTKKTFDDKQSIFQNYLEAFNLGAFGGGIGTDWSDVREVGHSVGKHGGTSGGVIPFLGISDRSTLGISQGGLRRASEAVYLDVSHPEIEEFIDLRKPTGDQNRRSPNLHHGIKLPDSFMRAVVYEQDWNLISPKDNTVVKTVKAKKLFTKLMEVRQTLKGEPYLMFTDTVNRFLPFEYLNEGIKVDTSNLCTEITLRTDKKHSGVCCLASQNLEYWDEYVDMLDQFVADCSDYLDNMLQDFIDKAKDLPGFERAVAGAIDERPLGLGVMGYHSYLQRKRIPFESPIAIGVNNKIFKMIDVAVNKHNEETPMVCPMAARNGTKKRNIVVTAIAPTMSISNLCGFTSSGIEPIYSNAYVKKLTQGTFPIRNKYLIEDIEAYANANISPEEREQWIKDQVVSVNKNLGSVQHLEWMDDWSKDVFKTAFEINQKLVIKQAADRQPFIHQAQSINIFIAGGSNVQLICDLHIYAWICGVKTLYYLRSSAKHRASTFANERKNIKVDSNQDDEFTKDTCIGCG